MILKFEINTDTMTGEDIAVGHKVLDALAGVAYENEGAEAAAAGGGETAAKKGTGRGGKKAAAADTATNELANAAAPMEEKSEPAVTLDALRTLATPIADDEANDGNAKFVALVEKHGGTKLSNVPKENYAALYADLVALGKSFGAKKGNALD